MSSTLPPTRSELSKRSHDLYDAFCRQRGLRRPTSISSLLRGKVGEVLKDLIYWPNGDPSRSNSLAFGLNLLESAIDPSPVNLLPLLPVDDRSIACVVCVAQDDWDNEDSNSSAPTPCEVVRWHLGVIPDNHQGALLDTDAFIYLKSVAEEISYRPGALERLLRRSQQYYSQFVAKENRPRKHILRPIQLACQNVIIGLAALQQDTKFDGLRVSDYLTCEVPHLATHEANRALVALILCDAFQSGGTMEIRFGPRNRDMPVPSALKRFARSIGLNAGAEDALAITPNEARKLFLAVTPMPDELRYRCAVMIDRGIITPERLCFTLMSGTWEAIELAYILATSPRSESILRGGAEFWQRRDCLAESEICRAALMTGMLFRRLSSQDTASGGTKGVRVFEDASSQIDFTVFEKEGAVAYKGFSGILPWLSLYSSVPALNKGKSLIVVPRGLPTPEDIRLVHELTDHHEESVVTLLTTSDSEDFLPADILVMRCPDRVRELDEQIERKNVTMRIVRA